MFIKKKKQKMCSFHATWSKFALLEHFSGNLKKKKKEGGGFQTLTITKKNEQQQ